MRPTTRDRGSVAHNPIFFGNGLLKTSGSTAPVDGTTLAGVAEKGSEYTAEDTGKLYINEGTKASPVWQLVTTT